MLLMLYNPFYIHRQYVSEDPVLYSVHSFIKTMVHLTFTQDEIDLLFRLLFYSSLFDCSKGITRLSREFRYILFRCLIDNYYNQMQDLYQNMIIHKEIFGFQSCLILYQILFSISKLLPQLLLSFIEFIHIDFESSCYFEMDTSLSQTDQYRYLFSISHLHTYMTHISDYLFYYNHLVSNNPDSIVYHIHPSVYKEIHHQLSYILSLLYQILMNLYSYDSNFLDILLFLFEMILKEYKDPLNKIRSQKLCINDITIIHISILLSMILQERIKNKIQYIEQSKFLYFYIYIMNTMRYDFLDFQSPSLSDPKIYTYISQLKYYFKNIYYYSMIKDPNYKWDHLLKLNNNINLNLPYPDITYSNYQKPQWFMNYINTYYSSLLFKTNIYCSKCQKPLYSHYYICVHCNHYLLCAQCYNQEYSSVMKYYINSIINDETKDPISENQHNPYQHFFIQILIPYIKYTISFPIQSFPLLPKNQLEFWMNQTPLYRKKNLNRYNCNLLLTYNKRINRNIPSLLVHMFLKQPKIDQTNKSNQNIKSIGFLNPSTKCSYCSISPIIGTYYICLNCNYILCSKCYIKEIQKNPCYYSHNISHVMLIINHPIDYQTFYNQRNDTFFYNSKNSSYSSLSSTLFTSIFPKNYFSYSKNSIYYYLDIFLLFLDTYKHSYSKIYTVMRQYSSLSNFSSIFSSYLIHLTQLNANTIFLDSFAFLAQTILFLFDIRVGSKYSVSNLSLTSLNIMNQYTIFYYYLSLLNHKCLSSQFFETFYSESSLYSYFNIYNPNMISQNYQNLLNHSESDSSQPLILKLYKSSTIESIFISFQYHLYSLESYQQFITNLQTNMKNQYDSILLLVFLFLYNPSWVSYSVYIQCFDIILHIIYMYFYDITNSKENMSNSFIHLSQLNCFQNIDEILYNGYMYICTQNTSLRYDFFYLLYCYYTHINLLSSFTSFDIFNTQNLSQNTKKQILIQSFIKSTFDELYSSLLQFYNTFVRYTENNNQIQLSSMDTNSIQITQQIYHRISQLFQFMNTLLSLSYIHQYIIKSPLLFLFIDFLIKIIQNYSSFQFFCSLPQYIKQRLDQYNPSFLLYYIIQYIYFLFPHNDVSLIKSANEYSVIQLNEFFLVYMNIYSLYPDYLQYMKSNNSQQQYFIEHKIISQISIQNIPINYYYMYYLWISKLNIKYLYNLYTIQDLFYTYYPTSIYNQSIDIILSFLSLFYLKYIYNTKDSFYEYLTSSELQKDLLNPMTNQIMLNPIQLESGYITDKYSLYIYMCKSNLDPLNHHQIQPQSIHSHIQYRNNVFQYISKYNQNP